MIELPAHLHPMVVHFPIALFITAMVFEIFSLLTKKEVLHKAAICMFVAAALVTPLVLRTGIMEATKLGINHPLLDQHRQYATWLMWFALMSLPILWLIKMEFKKHFRIVLILCLMVASVLVSVGADKGGRMVYEYGVGIEL